MMERRYSELIRLRTFDERFEYLRLDGRVSDITFGGSRLLNQALYHSDDWKSFRNEIIIRDSFGDYVCDLGCVDRDIPNGNKVILHHINPITKEDILNRDPKVMDPENVICCSLDTHNAIHYGDAMTANRDQIVERRPYDTVPWR